MCHFTPHPTLSHPHMPTSKPTLTHTTCPNNPPNSQLSFPSSPSPTPSPRTLPIAVGPLSSHSAQYCNLNLSCVGPHTPTCASNCSKLTGGFTEGKNCPLRVGRKSRLSRSLDSVRWWATGSEDTWGGGGGRCSIEHPCAPRPAAPTHVHTHAKQHLTPCDQSSGISGELDTPHPPPSTPARLARGGLPAVAPPELPIVGAPPAITFSLVMPLALETQPRNSTEHCQTPGAPGRGGARERAWGREGRPTTTHEHWLRKQTTTP
jgi:hypothetical protein